MKALLAALALLATAAAPPPPSTAIDSGVVVGARQDDVAVYRGIPFAAPPVGALRWRAPQPVERWKGERPASHFAAPCMQVPGRSFDTELPPGEDCLYLNVWTPAGMKRGAKLPVLVWIHGGAFRAGGTSDPRIAGELLARKGIVVVTVAYRIGVFGFFSHPALSAESGRGISGNYGLLDQIAALGWVQRNVGAFGGDPRKVTIGGMSAGAISAAMLAAAPDARGKFRAIISMSGGSFAPPRSPAEAGENMEPLVQSERHGVEFARVLGAPDLAALRAIPAERLLAANGQGVSWPVIDGVVVPGDEYQLFQAGRIADVPLLAGTTSDEGYSFSRIKTLAEYRADVARRYGTFAPRIFAAYPAATDAEAVRQGRDLLRDVMFGWGTFTWGRLQSQYGRAPAWVYYFDHAPPREPGTALDAGAVHGGDQPYPFGIAHQQRAWTSRDAEISAEMSGYFANFVRTLDPNGSTLIRWPRYSRAVPSVLHISATIAAAPQPNAATVQVIDDYMTLRRDGGRLGAP